MSGHDSLGLLFGLATASVSRCATGNGLFKTLSLREQTPTRLVPTREGG